MEYFIFIIVISIIFLLIYLINTNKKEFKYLKKEKEKLEKNILNLSNGQKEYLESSPLPSWAKDDKGNMIWLNSAYEKEFNVDKTDYIGHNDYDIWPEEIAAKFKLNDNDIIKNGKSKFFIEIVGDGKDKKILYVWKFPIKSINGKITQVGGICFNSDILKNIN
jgi:PAS domain-containing protein